MIYILKNVFSYETHAKKFLKINKYNYNYIYLFLRIFSHLIKTIKIINYVNNNFSEYVIVLKNNINDLNFLNFLKILKTSLLFKYKYLNDLTCSDNLNLLTKTTRFSLFYVLQNIITTSKLVIVRNIDKINFISSVTAFYNSACWAEREIFDLFGIFFLNHPDLRKILTDYGFSGFPLCKDFPLTGYLELRYCEELKCIKYNKLKLMQEYRNFNFLSPWQQYLKFKNNEI
jgi:NADH-quinone oxidoreductase subunit C